MNRWRMEYRPIWFDIFICSAAKHSLVLFLFAADGSGRRSANAIKLRAVFTIWIPLKWKTIQY